MENVRSAKGKHKRTKEAIFLRIPKAPLVIFLPIKNKTGYIGIQEKNNKYEASLTVKGKRIYVGTFIELKDAVIARNKYIENNNLKNRKNLI